MKTKPIKSTKLLDALYKELWTHPGYRDWMLFHFGINTALRVSEILLIKYKDIANLETGEIKTNFTVATKGDKTRDVYLNSMLRKDLQWYCEHYQFEPDEYIIFNRRIYDKPITRQMAHMILKKAAGEVGIDSFSTHSMRKTMATIIYNKTKDIQVVQHMLGHQSWKVTVRYIGIDQEEVEKAMEKYAIGFEMEPKD